MEKCLHSTIWITPKELNLLLRDYAMNQGYDKINYTNFAQDLYYVRNELACSKVMDTNIDTIAKSLHDACAAKSVNGKTIKLAELRSILRESKQLVLTPFQIAFLMGYSKPDIDAQVDFAQFAPVCKTLISNMFSLEAQHKKSQLIALNHFKTQNVRLPVYKDGVVFAAFRSFDIDYNGFLEWNEYQQCLTKQQELELTTEEVITLNLLADLDGDGRIDY
jgi:Ca2+-binding EF-hand superfamily protein